MKAGGEQSAAGIYTAVEWINSIVITAQGWLYSHRFRIEFGDVPEGGSVFLLPGGGGCLQIYSAAASEGSAKGVKGDALFIVRSY